MRVLVGDLISVNAHCLVVGNDNVVDLWGNVVVQALLLQQLDNDAVTETKTSGRNFSLGAVQSQQTVVTATSANSTQLDLRECVSADPTFCVCE